MVQAPEKEAPSAQNPTFEQALERLQQVVRKMESGQLSLEEALQAFEEGVKLTRICQEHLSAAEAKVEVLAKAGSSEAKPDFQSFSVGPQGSRT